jgi:hypothetical protein
MRRVLTVLFFGTLIALVVGGALFFREYNRVFPGLSPGFYGGMIVAADKKTGVPWALEVRPGGTEVYVSIGEEDLPAQRALVVEPSSGTRLPLIVSGEGRRLRITGVQQEEGRFKGEYSDPISAEKGAWTLDRVSFSELNNENRAVLIAWGNAWNVGYATSSAIQELQKKIELTKAQISQVQEVSAKSEGLRALLPPTDAERVATNEEAEREITSKKSELNVLIQTLDLSNKVSPAARLVALSRESIQRDAAWIENALHLTAPEESADFDEKYERARRVKALQDQIADERGLLKNIKEAPRYRREGAEINEEEEFYNGLR